MDVRKKKGPSLFRSAGPLLDGGLSVRTLPRGLFLPPREDIFLGCPLNSYILSPANVGGTRVRGKASFRFCSQGVAPPRARHLTEGGQKRVLSIRSVTCFGGAPLEKNDHVSLPLSWSLSVYSPVSQSDLFAILCLLVTFIWSCGQPS